MPIHEIDVLGIFASPIVVYMAISAVCTLAISYVVDRLIPYSLQRNEGLFSLLTFVAILALLMRNAF
jgi:hypothetical protein